MCMQTSHYRALTLGVLLGSIFSASAAYAWTGPTALPPNSNAPAPINVGVTDQVKNGGLSLNSLLVSGNAGITGNIGAGTATAYTKLQVGAGGDGWTNGLTIHSTYPTIYFRDTDHRTAMIHVNSNLFYVLRGCSSNDPAGGNSWCTYNGAWPLYLNLENNDAVFGGNIYAPAFLYSSDKRLKRDIKPLAMGLSEVEKLAPVSFVWTTEQNHGKSDIGFIAQDVEKVVPQVVHTDDKGYKSIDYVKLVPVLLSAIQEQQKEIDDLAAEIKKLRQY